MKALTQTRFGGPEVLELVDLPRPRLLPTEVLVRVHATSVNPVEAYIRSGAFPLLGDPPFVLGWDVSGVVEAVEPGSARFQVGDEVFGMPLFPRQAGAHAEYVASPSRQLARKPANLSHAQAAALPLCGLTALQALDDIARVQPGQRVLVHGAAGGVGHLAVQIARLLGAEVIATASAGKHDYLRSLGVGQLVDYRSTDFTTVVRDVDVVFDLIAQGYAQRSLAVLRPGGILVSAVERHSTELPALAAAAGKRFSGVAVEPDRGGLERLAAWAGEGRLVPHVAEVLPLRDAARAHARVAEGSLQGKLILSVA